MSGEVHIWAGVADPLLKTLLLPGTETHTLVFRAADRSTGFDHSDAAAAALRGSADALLLLRGATGAGERVEASPIILDTVRRAAQERAFVVVDPDARFATELDKLADYRKAVAKKALTERLGKPFVAPPEPALAGLFANELSDTAIAAVLDSSRGLFMFRHAGEWGIAPTLLSKQHAVADIAARMAGTGVAIVKAADQRSLPMW